MNKKLYIYSNNNDHRTTYFKIPPINLMESLGWIIVELNKSNIWNKELFIDYLKNNNIKVILCFCCDTYLASIYEDYIIENDIYLLSYSNDLHYKNNVVTDEKTQLKNIIHKNKNIYICANYYYCYLNFYNIDTQRIIKYPTFVDDDFIVDFNNEPIKKILLSGVKSKEYPARKKMNTISGYNNNIEVLNNGIVLGYDYIKYLNKFLCCFTCCSNASTPYIIGKFFEIPSSGSLLFAYDELVKHELKDLGFIDGENYIGCTLKNMEEKIEYILNPDNLEKINQIRKNGYDFVWKYHKQSDRLKYIDEFVNKKLL